MSNISILNIRVVIKCLDLIVIYLLSTRVEYVNVKYTGWYSNFNSNILNINLCRIYKYLKYRFLLYGLLNIQVGIMRITVIVIYLISMLYCLQLLELRDQAARSDGAAERSNSELRSARKRIDELASEISRLGSQVSYNNNNHNHNVSLTVSRLSSQVYNNNNNNVSFLIVSRLGPQVSCNNNNNNFFLLLSPRFL